MRTVRFGVIGCGLMGREFGSASARWCHFTGMDVKPVITAVSDINPKAMEWFQSHMPALQQASPDYSDVLANPMVEAVYIAVPHNLHERMYRDAISAGKHLMGEKPFGIDKPANARILACMRDHPDVVARCCSEFPFFPAMQQFCGMIESGVFGRIIEVNAGFLHSSDLNTEKPINWKRRVETNGEYGVMGDLGMHVCHVPFRAGWFPRNVRAVLSNIVAERPDGQGGRIPCDTWDNATLLCEAADSQTGDTFPMTLKMQRIAPGEMNTWHLEVKGMKACARFTTRNPQVLETLDYQAGKQDWKQVMTGYTPVFSTITGPIFEFGFPDGILQMWAAYLHELVHGAAIRKFTGTVTPAESAMSHELFTSALESQRTGATVPVGVAA
ncbi:MAG: Gfo/Idh/MocA family oxidoreductase [bacterium]